MRSVGLGCRDKRCVSIFYHSLSVTLSLELCPTCYTCYILYFPPGSRIYPPVPRFSASEGIDLKIRKISSVFGISFSATEQSTPPFEDMRMALAELRNSSDAFRTEMDMQEVVPFFRIRLDFPWLTTVSTNFVPNNALPPWRLWRKYPK